MSAIVIARWRFIKTTALYLGDFFSLPNFACVTCHKLYFFPDVVKSASKVIVETRDRQCDVFAQFSNNPPPRCLLLPGKFNLSSLYTNRGFIEHSRLLFIPVTLSYFIIKLRPYSITQSLTYTNV